MDSDPISESTPKRRKLDYTTVRDDFDDDSADELFDEAFTVPTQPLHQYRRPLQRAQGHNGTQSRPAATLLSQTQQPQGLFAQTLASINAEPFETQPTQILPSQSLRRTSEPRSSPEVEVLASSPPRGPGPPTRATPLSSSMAPPGTAFRRPLGVPPRPSQSQSQPQPQRSSQALSQRSGNAIDLTFDDPPIQHSSSDDDDPLQTDIKPTAFRAAKPLDVSRFAYTAGGDMASAYGGRYRPEKPANKQALPARAQAVEVEMTLDDILESQDRLYVKDMSEIMGSSYSIAKLYSTLKQAHGNKYDALNRLAEDVIDVGSSDDDTLQKNTQPLPSTKQTVKGKETIRERRLQAQSKGTGLIKPTINRETSAKAPEPQSKPRRRLIKGRKNRDADSDDEIDNIASVPSGSDSATEPEPEPQAEEPISSNRLLNFLNTCSSLELADLANEQADVAQLIVSQRPFRSFNDIREITDSTAALQSGKRNTKKSLGERVLDVCLAMWDGYEAVDKLVDQCKELGRPILETMKKWGVDMDAVTRNGELEIANLDDSHDSGIGTPAEDDIVSSKSKKSGFMLKQPENMAKDVVMKDYQVVGLNWINLLWSKKFSCILADDMGLGKTCQVISFFAHLKQTNQKGPHLVVVPGSTLENWGREFEKFCPDINVELYYGSQAEREQLRYEIEDNRDDVDVVVTTYETAVAKLDNKFLRKMLKPRVCVFDEGHMLKNATTKRHKELMLIPAQFRLLLTGTPLQNNLQELASLLGFILPELFEESAEDLNNVFKYKASTRDSSHSALLSTQRIERARSMMAPFILRRRKTQFAFLPPKTRRVEYCDMVPAQQALWDTLVAQAQVDRRNKAAGLATQSVTGTSRTRRKPNGAPETVHMTSLRFAALHPLLLRKMYTDDKLKRLQRILMHDSHSEYRGNPAALVWKFLSSDMKGGDFALHKYCVERSDFIPSSPFTLQDEEWMSLSGKIPVLVRLLNGWLPLGSRVLIFSQFTSLLNILESVLDTLKVRFCRIDGSTKMDDRQPLIDEFYKDEGIGVFMLSTRAGGAGINLAAADKVVIMEGGFNPQDEIQAENRAHRVGQTKPVEVVRLVTRGTIEELILKLGESKLALDERVHAGAGRVVDEGLGVRRDADATAAAIAVKDETDSNGPDVEGEKRVEEMFFQTLNDDSPSTASKTAGDAEAALEAAQKRLSELYPSLGHDSNDDHSDSNGDDLAVDVKGKTKNTLPQPLDDDTPSTTGADEDGSSGGRRSRRARETSRRKVLAEVNTSDEEDEKVESETPRQSRRTKGRGNASGGSSQQQQQHGADIGAMFRRGLRGRGLDVG